MRMWTASRMRRIVLDVNQFDGLAWSGTSVAWRQMKAVEGIEEQLKPNMVDDVSFERQRDHAQR